MLRNREIEKYRKAIELFEHYNSLDSVFMDDSKILRLEAIMRGALSESGLKKELSAFKNKKTIMYKKLLLHTQILEIYKSL